VSAAPSAPAAATSTPAAPPPVPPRTGALSDQGVVRRDSVRALRWDVTGTAKVLGDVDVGSGRSKGTAAVGGNLTADSFDARGILDVAGFVEVRSTLTTRGTFKAGVSVRSAEATLSGTVRSSGEVRITGALRMDGSIIVPSIKAGDVTLRGQVRVPGTVAAPRVEAVLEGDSAIGTIEATTVRLRRSGSNPLKRVLGGQIAVTIERIEAESVDLEGIDVEFVRGKAITLGRDCHVRTVEGTVLRAHPSSRVGPESRSPPPHGLTR
jgi:cytoskeletal protein CcmA (bactofilin family)